MPVFDSTAMRRQNTPQLERVSCMFLSLPPRAEFDSFHYFFLDQQRPDCFINNTCSIHACRDRDDLELFMRGEKCHLPLPPSFLQFIAPRRYSSGKRVRSKGRGFLRVNKGRRQTRFPASRACLLFRFLGLSVTRSWKRAPCRGSRISFL